MVPLGFYITFTLLADEAVCSSVWKAGDLAISPLLSLTGDPEKSQYLILICPVSLPN